MENQTNSNAPKRRGHTDTMLNPVPMKCESWSLRPRANQNQQSSDAVHQALLAICEYEINNLKDQWPLIGQYKQPPKRLRQNLHAYCMNADRQMWRNYDSATSRIRPLFRDIRLAIKTLNDQKLSTDQVNNVVLALTYKARVFLKRLAHDENIRESCLGARRFRECQKAAEKDKLLHEKLHPSVTFDLGRGWRVDRVVSRSQLLHAGKELGVCVGKQDSVSEQYFDALPSDDSQFWLISFQDQLECLLETVQGDSKCRTYNPEFPFLVEEQEGLDEVVENMPTPSLRNLLTSLKLDVNCPGLNQLGVFSVFLDHWKDKREPDARVSVDESAYEMWFHKDQIIVYREPSNLDREEVDAEFIEWELFKREDTHFGIDSLRMIDDGACIDPDPRCKISRWTRQGCSDISEDDLLNALAQLAFNSCTVKRY